MSGTTRRRVDLTSLAGVPIALGVVLVLGAIAAMAKTLGIWTTVIVGVASWGMAEFISRRAIHSSGGIYPGDAFSRAVD